MDLKETNKVNDFWPSSLQQAQRSLFESSVYMMGILFFWKMADEFGIWGSTRPNILSHSI